MPKRITSVLWEATPPSGLLFDSETGTFSGTPSLSAGGYTVPVKVTTNYGIAEEHVTINVQGPAFPPTAGFGAQDIVLGMDGVKIDDQVYIPLSFLGWKNCTPSNGVYYIDYGFAKSSIGYKDENNPKYRSASSYVEGFKSSKVYNLNLTLDRYTGNLCIKRFNSNVYLRATTSGVYDDKVSYTYHNSSNKYFYIWTNKGGNSQNSKIGLARLLLIDNPTLVGSTMWYGSIYNVESNKIATHIGASIAKGEDAIIEPSEDIYLKKVGIDLNVANFGENKIYA